MLADNFILHHFLKLCIQKLKVPGGADMDRIGSHSHAACEMFSKPLAGCIKQTQKLTASDSW